jgi:putative nucleotidyltransferase with HDIG domain
LIKNSELQTKQLHTIMSLSRSVEARDPYTKGHSDRVAMISKAIAENIPELDTEIIYQSGLIHDVGKLTTPDNILLKKGRLTDQEYLFMKRHTVEGATICNSLGIPEELTNGVLYHHERWDGNGYPSGLKGEEIPIVARVLCIADAIDAMSSNRAYREAMDFSAIRAEIEKGNKTQFDPIIAKIVLRNWDYIVQLIQTSHEKENKVEKELA